MTAIYFNKRNALEAADRLYRLYSRQMPDEISVCLGITAPAGGQQEKPIVEPHPDDDVCRERDPLSWKELPVLLEMYRRGTRHNYENPSDSLPAQLPVFHFENAIETAMLGGQVKFMGTRLHTFGDPVEPLIREYDAFRWRLPEEDNVWFQRYLEAYRFMVKHAGNDFALAWQGGFMGLNLAVQLRGTTQAYVDMTEEPANLRRLLDYAYDFNVYLYGRVEEIVGAHNRRLYGDHPLAAYRVDFHPNQSLDAYALCRPGTLREWDMANLIRFNRRIGGGMLHIHENSRHIVEEVTEIPGWTLVYFTDGTGWPRSFDLRWELRRRMKNIPIAFGCGKDEFMAALERRDLPGNVQYNLGVDSLDEAQRLMERARAYRARTTA